MAKMRGDAFEIGAVVQLKSGGPALTVLGQVGDRVHGVFFSDELGEFRETMLPAVALEEVEFEELEEAEEEEEEEDEDEEDEDDKKAPAKLS
jgi:uncharacterized protein YodC (DUF2158 family)